MEKPSGFVGLLRRAGNLSRFLDLMMCSPGIVVLQLKGDNLIEMRTGKYREEGGFNSFFR